jgi:hypothetical protein
MPQTPRKRRGCFFYGCLTCIVLLLLAFAILFAAVHFIKKQIYAFTDATPVKLPRVEMADSELQQLQQRVTIFHDTMQQGKPGEPLVLTEREVNALIARAPNMKDVADKVYVSLDGDQVKGQVSYPMPGWLAKGRYLNGEAAFKVSLENGVLIVTAQEIQVQGKPLPESFMAGIRKENLAKEVCNDPDKAEVIRKLDSIEVQDGKAIIKAKAAQ